MQFMDVMPAALHIVRHPMAKTKTFNPPQYEAGAQFIDPEGVEG